MHDTCNAANAAARATVAAKVRAGEGEAHFGVDALAALPESVRETFDGCCHNHTMQLPFK